MSSYVCLDISAGICTCQQYGAILREIIGCRLATERDRLGFSQNDLAKQAGVSRRSQIDWESGKSMPNAEYLAAVASVGIDVLYVLTGKYSTSTLSKEDSEFLAGLRLLDPRSKAGVMALLSGLNPASSGDVIHGNVGQIVRGDNQAPFTMHVDSKRKGRS